MNQRYATTNINRSNKESQREANLYVFDCNFVVCLCTLFAKCLDREGMCMLGIVISLVIIFIDLLEDSSQALDHIQNVIEECKELHNASGSHIESNKTKYLTK